ncbi:hypothetical protein Tco_1236672 [Tanacetum coccineum]
MKIHRYQIGLRQPTVTLTVVHERVQEQCLISSYVIVDVEAENASVNSVKPKGKGLQRKEGSDYMELKGEHILDLKTHSTKINILNAYATLKTRTFYIVWSRDVEWETCSQNSDFGWTRMAEPVMKLYTESTDATSIEIKENHLETVLANEPVAVKKGQYIVEVKPQVPVTCNSGLIQPSGYKPVEAFKTDLERSPPEAIDERCKIVVIRLSG